LLGIGIVGLVAGTSGQNLALQLPKESTAIIELPRQTMIFKPTRQDMTVGRVVLSVYCSKAADVRVNGVKADPAWNEIHLTPAGEIVVDKRNRIAPADGSAWLYIYPTRLATNQFELPALRIEMSTNEPQSLLCLSVKVWFNEISNQYDSMYYQNLDDRYALVSFCTRAPEPSEVRSRFKQNRVATVDEFKQALGKPFVLKLNQRALRKERAP
jgi:hypothetical protein